VPDGFSANASLKPLSTLSRERSLDGTVIELPRLKDAEAFDLIDRRRGDRNISQIPDQLLSVLELSGSSLAIDKVTPESPIVISSVRSLEPDEGILTLAHDGNFWLPVGYGMLKEDGKTEIEVQHLVTRGNKDTQDGDRKISEAISLCFLKVVVQSQQSAWLRKATPKPDGTVSFTPKGDLESVRKAVAQAERIVLFIHGILGDSENMIPSVLAAGLLNSNGSQEQGKYDLVLAFDYENLNTKIQETANELKEQLKKVGLGNGHKKTLHIIAHSIGGLVSRSFIEQHGGNKVVNHLLMLGTPNGGSQWSSVYQLATTLLSVGLNFIPESFVAGPFVSLLTKKDIEKMSTTLRQMNIQESDLLPELRRSEDPQCPYTIIGGNTQLNEKLKTKADNLLQALEQKVWKGLEFPFKGQSNDIAVTVESIFTREVFEGRNPAVNLIDSVACNHLVYFKDQNGLNALAGAVRQAFELPVESENQSAASTSSSSALQTRTASWFDTTDVVAIGIDDDKNVVPYLGKAVNHAVKTPKIIEQVSPTDNWLNTVETDFVTESGNRRNFITRRNWGIAIGVILGLSGLTIVAINRQRSAEIQAIRASIESSEALMASNQTLDARIASLRAGRGLQELSWQAIWPEEELKDQVRANLQHVVADEGNIVPWRFVGNIDQLLSINCAWVRDYLEHNPNVVERDRRLCDGVPELKQVAPQISTIPSSALSTLTPQGFPPAPKANAEDYYTRGNEKANSKYLENFPKIIAKSSTNAKKADAYVNRGVMHFRQKKYAKAIEDYTKAIALAPNNANAYINRGIAYSSQGNHERAIKDYNEALNIDTKNADAGVALSGDDNPAQKSAKGNLSNHPASGQNSDAYINRGIAYSSQGRHEWAIKDYDEALKIAPDSADAYYAKGFTLALIEGKKQEAIDNYRTAADLYRQEKKPSYYENTLKKIEELKRDRQGAVRQPE
jgi:tetratricopeptide (TPR) repeat protein/triacylglycerol esterase/lipase EstA (alpha/beta hydrolase family)